MMYSAIQMVSSISLNRLCKKQCVGDKKDDSLANDKGMSSTINTTQNVKQTLIKYERLYSEILKSMQTIEITSLKWTPNSDTWCYTCLQVSVNGHGYCKRQDGLMAALILIPASSIRHKLIQNKIIKSFWFAILLSLSLEAFVCAVTSPLILPQ